ncbi:hypothetical protein H4Q26_000673 [Puccinia striiformis f. sp. tritici PST-130]|nr:hypothetical protein H4Q26_000673 [Puccinia striiformis f. sp. tritici PST-130]
MSSSTRAPAKPVKIYRRGKQSTTTTKPSSSSSCLGSSDEEEQEQRKPNQLLYQSSTYKLLQSIKNNNKQVTDSDSSNEEEEDNSKPQPKGDNDSEEHSSGSSSGSGDSESSSEEEKLVPIYKPVFITKRNRETILNQPNNQSETELENKRIEEDQRRKLSTQKLVEQTLIREISEKEVDQVFPDVDDTDGLDPESEFESWKLRELKRLRRDREILIKRAKEKEEIEARRLIPESEQLKEDTQYADQTRKSKPKGTQVFLQKYHHKGAFYADSDIHTKHDYTAPTEGTFTKMELLPEVMQVRDFGKMSRTKWTHLSKEDTTSMDAGWSKKNPGRVDQKSRDSRSSCFGCGQQGHIKQDCPKNQNRATAGSGGGRGNGSNQIALGERVPSSSSKSINDHKRRASSSHQEHSIYPSKKRGG